MAETGDIRELVRLLSQLFAIEEDFDFDESLQEKGLAMMLGSPSDRCVMAARVEGGTVGMCTAQLVVSTAEGGLSGLVEDLVVDEKHRGKGIGSLLLEAAENWCIERGAKRIQLLADATNEKGLGFYRKKQWKHTKLICLRRKFGLTSNLQPFRTEK